MIWKIFSFDASSKSKFKEISELLNKNFSNIKHKYYSLDFFAISKILVLHKREVIGLINVL